MKQHLPVPHDVARLRARCYRLAVLVALVAVAPLRGEEVIVTGARVNIRAGAGLDHKIVTMAVRGDRLDARTIGSEWVEVAPPADMEFWIHRDFVDGDRVVGNDVNVRSGPSIRDVTLARLPRGEQVNVRSEAGPWLLIAAPRDVSLWISRGLVEPAADARTAQLAPAAPRSRPVSTPAPRVAEPTPAPATQRSPAPPATVAVPAPAPAPAPAAPRVWRRAPAVPPPPAPAPVIVQRPLLDRDGPSPAGAATASSIGTGGTVYRGVVQPAGLTLYRPAYYRLVERLPGRSPTVCYLAGDPMQLAACVGRSVIVRGDAVVVQGVREPLLRVATLEQR